MSTTSTFFLNWFFLFNLFFYWFYFLIFLFYFVCLVYIDYLLHKLSKKSIYTFSEVKRAIVYSILLKIFYYLVILLDINLQILFKVVFFYLFAEIIDTWIFLILKKRSTLLKCLNELFQALILLALLFLSLFLYIFYHVIKR